MDLKKKREHLITKFKTVGIQNKLYSYSGSTVFSEKKIALKLKNNKIDNTKELAVNQHNNKMTQKTLFNLGKKFFRIVKYKSKTRAFYNNVIYKFQKQFIYLKNAQKLIRRILLKKIFSRKSQFENKLINIKKIIEEKSDLILKIEHENSELRKHYENSRKETKATLLENEVLKEKIQELDERLNYDDVNFKDLFNKNISDIQSIFIYFFYSALFLNLIFFGKKLLR